MTPVALADPTIATRKPRIALMGEFSAGKSTLANILMSQDLSPVQITATQRPPIWYAHGQGGPFRIAADGSETPIAPEALDEAKIADTLAIRVFAEAEILDACDLIDMPGSSDPNISVDIWQSVLPIADGVIWCTPATQAWRQSEAAMWETVHEKIGAHSLLLMTRIDKILTAEDRSRVVKRVKRETAGMFRTVIPVSLTMAQAAGEDAELWAASGLDEVCDALAMAIAELEPVIANKPKASIAALESLTSGGIEKPQSLRRDLRAPFSQPETRITDTAKQVSGGHQAEGQVMPRRVTNAFGPRSRRARPGRSDASSSLI
jgi:hypothetical protein